MKKLLLIISFLPFLSGCGNRESNFTLSGHIDGLGNDTLYIYAQEKTENGLDTIIAGNGSFEYSLKVDTVTPLILIVNNQRLPVFADKLSEVTIQGELAALSGLQIRGGRLNDQLNTFRSKAGSLRPGKALDQMAERYIREHPDSPTSLYVLDRYFVQRENPDYPQIGELIKLLSVDLQDQAPVKELSGLAELETGVEAGKAAPFFSSKDRTGKSITLNDFKDQHLVMAFWASWATSTSRELKAIQEVAGKYKKKKVAFLGVSLDLERDRWLEALKKDTLAGTQVTDLKGWESPVVRQYGIGKLPSNLLIGPDKKIIARNLTGEELEDKLAEIFK